jgi:hypothetical protein
MSEFIVFQARVSWYRSTFVVAVIVMGTGVCFTGLSFGSYKKLEVVIAGPLSGTESCSLSFGSCKKLEFVIAGPLSGTESCSMLFGSCKKLEVVIAGPLSGTESCLIVEAGPSFVSDFRGIVQKVA